MDGSNTLKEHGGQHQRVPTSKIRAPKQMLVVMAYINPRSTNGWWSGGWEGGRQAGRHTNSIIVEQQLKTIEEIMQLENHHLMTTILIGSGKNHQRIIYMGSRQYKKTRPPE